MPMENDYPAIAVKASVDEALISYYSRKKGLPDYKIDISIQSYPEPKNRFAGGYSVIKTSGAFYFFIPPVITFVVILIEIVREKELRLRNGLSMMGMSSTPYWHV